MKKLLPLILCPLITYGAAQEDLLATPRILQGVKRDRTEYTSSLHDPKDLPPQGISRPIPRLPRISVPDVNDLDLSRLAISDPAAAKSPYGFRARVADAMERGAFERIIFKPVAEKK